jgi:hypothetical protein
VPWLELIDFLRAPATSLSLVLLILRPTFESLGEQLFELFVRAIDTGLQDSDWEVCFLALDLLASLVAKYPGRDELYPFFPRLNEFLGDLSHVGSLVQMMNRWIDCRVMLFEFRAVLEFCFRCLSEDLPPTTKVAVNHLLTAYLESEQAAFSEEDVATWIDLEVRVAAELCVLNDEDPNFQWTLDVGGVVEAVSSSLPSQTTALGRFATGIAAHDAATRFAHLLVLSSVLYRFPTAFQEVIDDVFPQLLGLLEDLDGNVAAFAAEQIGVLATRYPYIVNENLSQFLGCAMRFVDRSLPGGVVLIGYILEVADETDSVFWELFEPLLQYVQEPEAGKYALQSLRYLLQKSLTSDQVIDRILETNSVTLICVLCMRCPAEMDVHAANLSALALECLGSDDPDARRDGIELVEGLVRLTFADWIPDAFTALRGLLADDGCGGGALILLALLAQRTRDPGQLVSCLGEIAQFIKVSAGCAAHAFLVLKDCVTEESLAVVGEFVNTLVPGLSESELVFRAIAAGLEHVSVPPDMAVELAQRLVGLASWESPKGQNAIADLVEKLARGGSVGSVASVIPFFCECITGRNVKCGIKAMSSIFLSPVADAIDPDGAERAKFLDLMLGLVDAQEHEVARLALLFIAQADVSGRLSDVLAAVRNRLLAIGDGELRETLVYVLISLAIEADRHFPFDDILPLILANLVIRICPQFIDPALQFLQGITHLLLANRELAIAACEFIVNVFAHRRFALAVSEFRLKLTALALENMFGKLGSQDEIVGAVLAGEPELIDEFQMIYGLFLDQAHAIICGTSNVPATGDAEPSR